VCRSCLNLEVVSASMALVLQPVSMPLRRPPSSLGVTGGVVSATILSEAGGPVSVLSPWPAAPEASVRVSGPGGQSLPLAWSVVGGTYGGPVLTFDSTAGESYLVAVRASAL
jgi:hypothetical protein